MTSQDYDYINVVIAILCFLVPAFELILRKDSTVTGIKKISPIGWVLFSIAIIMGTVSFFSIKKSLQEKTNQQHLMDSTRKADKKEILDGIGEAIGKYGLGYDSAKKEISALKTLIKDSIKNKTTIIQGANPNVIFTDNNGISIDSIKSDAIFYHVSISSYSAPAILKHATVYLLTSYLQDVHIFDDLKYCSQLPFLTNNLGIDKGASKNEGFFHSSKKVKNIKTIVIWLKGSFTDSYGKNVQQIDKVGVYDILTKNFGIMVSTFDDDVRTAVKKATGHN